MIDMRIDNIIRVSILVVLDQPLRHSTFIIQKYRIEVSILVVLDQPLRRYLHEIKKTSVFGFNPCCPGSASSTVMGLK